MLVQRCGAPAPREPILTVDNAPSRLEVGHPVTLLCSLVLLVCCLVWYGSSVETLCDTALHANLACR